ncbi:MAG: hypothetical protein ACI9DF_002469 [Verrucomicrobiales bacterium]|jgi:hypothetical protein
MHSAYLTRIIQARFLLDPLENAKLHRIESYGFRRVEGVAYVWLRSAYKRLRHGHHDWLSFADETKNDHHHGPAEHHRLG